ncbi:MAG: FAD-dependent oxidoreductase [Rhodospirillales bacterium 70-18]|nr:FAD-binding oxidoreductase [Rhodospirillales bacterium]OJY67278.1 MAG: FAD-dependent oxidoreductase [Rhodospirillales bacterium 70-18]
MDTHTLDVIVVGAGIAGATAGAQLAADHKVALIEAEEAAGYHSTGRSAALWILNYGPPDVRVLTGLSRAFFESPPPGFAETPLMSHRPVLTIASADTMDDYRHVLETGTGLRELTPEAAREMVPALRPGYVAAAVIEDDTFDMDVATLHQGFLKLLRARGGRLALRSRSMRIERKAGLWEVEVTGGEVLRAPTLVNAAGAWGDEVAAQAGVATVGLQPKRRTGVIIDPAPWAVAAWPAIMDAAGTWYSRPEARTRLMVSPVDETPMPPHDVQPDELDVAIAIDRMQQALDINVTRVERSWSGLRSFVPDGSLVIGWDAVAEGFFWSIGQGGYGIQTSPAAGKLVADLVSGRDPGPAARILNDVDPNRFARTGPGTKKD